MPRLKKTISRSERRDLDCGNPLLKTFYEDKCKLQGQEAVVASSECLHEDTWIVLTDRRIVWGSNKAHTVHSLLWDQCFDLDHENALPEFDGCEKLYTVIPIREIKTGRIHRIEVDPSYHSLFWKLLVQITQRTKYFCDNRDTYLSDKGFDSKLKALLEKECGSFENLSRFPDDNPCVVSIRLKHANELVICANKMLILSESKEGLATIDGQTVVSIEDNINSDELTIVAVESQYKLEFLSSQDTIFCKSLVKQFIVRNNFVNEITRVSNVLVDLAP